MEDAFRLVKTLRSKKLQIPIVLFSYLNPILHHGIENVAKALQSSGFEGLVVPDLPPDEAREVERVFRRNRLDLIYLVAPTTESKRRGMLMQKSHGFIYYVSLKGVTGARKKMASDLSKLVIDLKKKSKKPVLVGFGVSSPKQVKEICRFADGVIVGSAIIDSLTKNNFSVSKTARFVRSLVWAAKS